MPEFGLINMNGRLYDPMTGRMLSPDPDVTYPEVPLSYNRYAYAMNNPVNFVDPNGENPLLIGALIGMAINTITHINDINTFGDFAKAAVIGAASGFLGGITGLTLPVGAIPGIIAGGIGGASTGAFSNLLNAAAFGGDLSQAMASGAIAGAVTGGLIGGIGGYMKAQKLKLNPWTGKPATTTQPNTADDLLATGGSDEFYGRPVEELKYNIREINVDIVDDLYEYDITFALKRFHTFQQTIPQNLPGVIGTTSCLSGVAAYITDKWTAEAIRNDWNGGKDASGDYEDFVNKYFKGGSSTLKDE